MERLSALLSGADVYEREKEVPVCTPPYHSAVAVNKPRSAARETVVVSHMPLSSRYEGLRAALRMMLFELAREQFATAGCVDERELRGRARALLVSRIFL